MKHPSMLTRIRRLVPGSWGYLCLLAGVSLFFALVSVGASAAFGNLTSQMAQLSFGALKESALWIALLFTGQCLLEFSYSSLRGSFTAHIGRCLRTRAIGSINGAQLPWLQKIGAGDLLGRLQTELELAAGLLGETLPNLILQGINIIVFCSVMLFVSWQLALAYLGSVAAIVVLQTLLSKPIQTKARLAQEKRAQANSMAHEIIAQRTTIKAYNAQSLVLGWYQNLLNPWLKTTLSGELVASPLRTLGWVCGMAPTFTLCIAGAMMVRAGSLSLAGFMTVYFLAEQMGNDCMHYIDLFVVYRKGAAGAQRLWEAMEAPQEPNQAQRELVAATGGPLLSFEQVSFTYEGQQEPALKDFSLQIAPGEKVALVGASGCGKSTALRLALGFLAPQQGRLLFQGQAYEQLGLQQVRQNLSFVPQFPFLFCETLKNNITLPKGEELPPAQMAQLYQQACISPFLQDLSQGENTGIGESGVHLSTGQGQRVALARGFAKEAPLLILDEATSALDAQSDEQIFASIAALPPSTGVLMVTHRLTHLDSFDTIYVMERGKIVQRGNHGQLLAAQGPYANLWNLAKGAAI